MSYELYALISVILFACVHLYGQQASKLHALTHGRMLSFGGGVAIAYVFIDLLPKLAQSDALVRQALEGLFPYVERHVYLMALVGFLLFFIVDRSSVSLKKNKSFWLSICSYALFNFLMGYAVVDKNNPEVQPLVLFTIAMGLHYFTNDYSLRTEHKRAYEQFGCTILIIALFLGWSAGVWITLPQTAVAIASAFIAGGVIMNVTRHELPKQHPNSLISFLFAAALYTVLLLMIGAT
jgi:hypothetical protein